MKKTIIVFTTIFIVLFSFVLSFRSFFNSNYYNIENYSLHYYSDLNRYDIMTKKNKIIVEKKKMVICLKTPCTEPLIERFSVNLNNEYVNFFKDIFIDGTYEKNINKDALTNEDFEILKKIIKLDDSLSYNILMGSMHSTYKLRGYYEINSNPGENVVIASGERPVRGLTIDIVRVEINKKNVLIYVKESKDGIITKGITNPVAVIKFNTNPEKIVVKNIDTGEEFNKIN